MARPSRLAIAIVPLAMFVSLQVLVSRADGVTIDLVTVGNPANSADSTGFGGVAEVFDIGKYEVTNDQYAEFLNAVAKTDTHALYHTNMGANYAGGITRTGSSGSYTYSVKDNMGDKPVNYVSFWDAARFANWLHNGQPTGSQTAGTTEDGAYALGGVTAPDNSTITREPGAMYFLPSHDEWYKAAYHHPQADGGDSDDWWDYPTRSNDSPTPATADSVGNISNPGENVVNFDKGAEWNDEEGNVTTVGSAGALSASYYGTFDQAGNIFEWTDTITGTQRITRGGSWKFSWDLAASGAPASLGPTGALDIFGFRVAAVHVPPAVVPEPRAALLALIGGLILWAYWRRRRSR
ncbi:MAG: SUMF1/EgtB/PvdO family nonheme iron enzyme [Pirellulales bacterium]